MIDSAAAADLLDECHAVLTRELIPLLPADRRYEARMIAGAIARVSRQITRSCRAATTEIEAIEQLTGERQPVSANGEASTGLQAPPDTLLEAHLAAARVRLCEAVRAGQFDDRLDNRDDLLRLREIAHARLQITNPKLISQGS